MRKLLYLFVLWGLLSPVHADSWSVVGPTFPVWGQPNEVVQIHLKGPAKKPPRVTVGPSGKPLQLTETEPGHYRGVFRLPEVGPKDLVLHAQGSIKVLGRVTSSPWRKVFKATKTTVARQGPAPAFDRHSPVLAGTQLDIDGSQGGWHRSADSGIWLDGKTGTIKPGSLAPNRVNRVLIENLSGGDAALRLKCRRRPQVEAVHRPDQGRLELTIYAAHTVFDIKRPTAVAPFLGVVSTLPSTRPQTVKLEIATGPRGIGGYSFEPGSAPGELVVRLRKPLPKTLKGLKITLDAGHGGPEDTGTVGHGGLPEKVLNLRVTKALAKLLKDKGAQVTMTRTQDLDLDLQGRVDLSKAAGSQLFLSIHHNARPLVAEGKKYHGTDVYWYHPQSQPLARALADPIADAIGESLRSSRYRSFYVVRQTHSPAVLIEFQYLSNPGLEADVLDREDYPGKSAAAVVEGLEKFLESRP